MTDHPPATPLSDSELADLEKLYAEATPGPWRWNSYSMIMDDAHALVWGTEEDTSPDYPDRKDRPSDSRGTDWQEQFDAAYEADPEVASVPPHHGDTATGRHAKDAQLIEELHTAFPRLAAAYRAQAARLAEAEREVVEVVADKAALLKVARMVQRAYCSIRCSPSGPDRCTTVHAKFCTNLSAALSPLRAGEPEGAGDDWTEAENARAEAESRVADRQVDTWVAIAALESEPEGAGEEE